MSIDLSLILEWVCCKLFEKREDGRDESQKSKVDMNGAVVYGDVNINVQQNKQIEEGNHPDPSKPMSEILQQTRADYAQKKNPSRFNGTPL